MIAGFKEWRKNCEPNQIRTCRNLYPMQVLISTRQNWKKLIRTKNPLRELRERVSAFKRLMSGRLDSNQRPLRPESSGLL